MNLRFIDTFVVLSELRNFRMTAERLHTTQAAISSRIATLEQELGVRLFQRGPREVTLTEEGQKALGYAERILKLTREMKDDLRDVESYAGTIRIGVIEAIVHSWFPDFLATLHRLYPRIQVEIASDTSLHLIEQLDKSTIDLTLQVQLATNTTLTQVSLGAFPMTWVGSPRLGIGDEPLCLSDLAAFPVMSFSRGSGPHAIIENIFSGVTNTPLHLNCISSVATMIRVVCDGLGVAAIPPAIILRELSEQRLRQLPVDRHFPALSLAACYRNERSGSLVSAVVKIAEKTATDFALKHGPSIAQLPESG